MEYIVKRGETVQGIALRFNLLPETIWDYTPNAELRSRRPSMGVLLPGDVLQIPDLRIKTVRLATSQAHRFVVRGRTMRFRVRFLINDEPRANEPYEIEIDAQPRTGGTTNGSGWLDVVVPVHTKRVRVVFDDRAEDDDPDDIEEHVFRVGALDPLDSETGVQSRLQNLGFYSGVVDGDIGELTASALRAFQRRMGLRETGEVDDSTRAALGREYGV